jgi:uncharacterized membrane protein YdjX (TVP38/TMEM64 family)
MRRRTAIRLGVVVLLVVAVGVAYLSPLRDYMTRDSIREFVENLRGIWYGPGAFIVVFALGCVLGLPASLFVIASGLIWGWILGGVYAIVGGMIGAVASFYLGRFVGDGLLVRFGRVGRMVARQVDHAGFKSLLLARYIPGIPFAVVNYGAGVAGVRLRHFVPATLLGIAPAMFIFAYSADALFNGSLTEGDAVKRLLLVSVLMFSIILIPFLVRRFARRVPAVVETAEDQGL